MSLRRPSPSFDAAAKQANGTTNADLLNALVHLHERLEVAERALNISGLNSQGGRKTAPIPPRANITVNGEGAGSGQFTLSITNPEFIPGRGNPLRAPLYHRVRFSTDPAMRTGVTPLPPSTQTHWPIRTLSGTKMYFQVDQSFDGANWNTGIVHGPVTA